MAADPSISASLCKDSAGGTAACLVESVCQDDYTASLQRIAHALVLGE